MLLEALPFTLFINDISSMFFYSKFLLRVPIFETHLETFPSVIAALLPVRLIQNDLDRLYV